MGAKQAVWLSGVISKDMGKQNFRLGSGERMELFGGATLLRLGGHFPGSAVLHWAPGANGRGLLCSGAP